MKIEFCINKSGELIGGTLVRNQEVVEEMDKLTIPSIVEETDTNGRRSVTLVESIKDTFRVTFQRLYERGVRIIHKLIIEDGIERIANGAFAGIDIEINTVYWPKTCNVIPQYCFSNSKIKSIVGIEGVAEIETAAFQGTSLKYFDWPARCKEIPDCCFQMSELEMIEGLDQVVNIGDLAFRATKLKCFNWPERCKVVPSHCFYECNALEQIVGLEEVTDIRIAAFNETALKTFCWPAGVSATETCLFLSNCEHLEEIIFGGVGIKDVDLECLSYLKDVKKIDLSKCGAVNLINCSSPKGRKLRDKVVLPYYVTEIN